MLCAALPWSWFVLRDTAAIFEWVAILLPLLALGAVVLLLAVAWLFRSREIALLVASGIVVTLVAVVAPWTPASTGPPRDGVRLVAANVFGNNQHRAAVTRDLLAAKADVLVVSELTTRQAHVADSLDASYPYRLGEDHDEVRVWSNFPLQGNVVTGEINGANGAEVTVQAPAGPFLLYALHLYRPSLRALGDQVTVEEQARLVRKLNERMATADLPVVVAGDLNLTDRGTAFRAMAKNRRDAARAGWTGPTSFRARNRPLLLRIDHLLIPRDWCTADAHRVRLTGSDHRGVAARIGPCGKSGNGGT